MTKHDVATVFLLLLAAALFGGACSTQRVPASPSESVCAIKTDPTPFLHRQVTLNAVFKTDNSHYSYLADASCKDVVLAVGDASPAADESVRKFTTMTAGVIDFPVEVDVSMEGVIGLVSGGRVVIHPTRVLYYGGKR